MVAYYVNYTRLLFNFENINNIQFIYNKKYYRYYTMKLFSICCYGILITVLIIVLVMVDEKDKQEEVKYHSGLDCNNKKGSKMLQVKARDGALSGLIMGGLTGGPIGGLVMAAKYGLVNPIVGGLNHLRNTDERLVHD
jgi:hypothetical protein